MVVTFGAVVYCAVSLYLSGKVEKDLRAQLAEAGEREQKLQNQGDQQLATAQATRDQEANAAKGREDGLKKQVEDLGKARSDAEAKVKEGEDKLKEAEKKLADAAKGAEELKKLNEMVDDLKKMSAN